MAGLLACGFGKGEEQTDMDLGEQLLLAGSGGGKRCGRGCTVLGE